MVQPSHGDEKQVGNLELLSVDELERLIQQKMSSEGIPDIESLKKLTEAVKRKQHYPAIDAHQALDMFKSTYMSEREDTKAKASVQSRSKKKHRKYVRIFLVVAIMAALLFILIIVAQAANINIFNIFGFWTDEEFYFGSQYTQDSDQQVIELPEPPKNREFSSLQEVFSEMNIHDKILPTWQPEEHELVELKVSDAVPGRLRFEAFYQDGEDHYSIEIILYSDAVSAGDGNFEKDSEPMELYDLNGHTAYIFSNLEEYMVTWMDGHYRISVSGNLELETLIHIVESIYI